MLNSLRLCHCHETGWIPAVLFFASSLSVTLSVKFYAPPSQLSASPNSRFLEQFIIFLVLKNNWFNFFTQRNESRGHYFANGRFLRHRPLNSLLNKISCKKTYYYFLTFFKLLSPFINATKLFKLCWIILSLSRCCN